MSPVAASQSPSFDQHLLHVSVQSSGHWNPSSQICLIFPCTFLFMNYMSSAHYRYIFCCRSVGLSLSVRLLWGWVSVHQKHAVLMLTFDLQSLRACVRVHLKHIVLMLRFDFQSLRVCLSVHQKLAILLVRLGLQSTPEGKSVCSPETRCFWCWGWVCRVWGYVYLFTRNTLFWCWGWICRVWRQICLLARNVRF